ncbi:Plasmid recombination enzyme [Pseudomonas guineae]|uniref:Plasmid recombination enzyme n=1 Tax=Pseudomonas guineae TaxID=425504 RepID=A0A1I3JNK6_9PSED|nr:MobV family relaxase [Pseudomonas guineae]SFI61831.1 Plasmid recombination enzyme [Pseudomonas guineae]
MYAILRAQKHKSLAGVARSARHTFREQLTFNADSNNTYKNRFSGCRGTKDLLNKLTDRLPALRRRDAVLCIEYLITASPEAFSRHGGHLDDLGSGYFADALNWLRARHGEENVISAALHLDETTPHLVAYVTPITRDGRLCAREYLGGPKVMRGMQDSFHLVCGEPHGLVRGVQGSKAHHTEVAQFYTALHGHTPTIKLTARDYAAKALGHETEVWRQAQALANQHAQQAAVVSLQRKALSSRFQALADAEQQAEQAVRRLDQFARDLEKRDRSLAQRERELMRRQPALDIAIARAESLERLWGEREKKAEPEKYLNFPRPAPCPS